VDVVLGPHEMRGLYELLGRNLDRFPDVTDAAEDDAVVAAGRSPA
jgi:hypothetical protein